MKTVRPGHQRFCGVSHKGNIYTFHNLRDFRRTVKDEGLKQKQHWIEQSYNIKKITSLDMYICPFAFHNLVGHTILTFGFSDGERLCITVEGEQYIGKDYSMLTAIYPGYRIRFVRGTEQDIINLRTQLRGDKIYRYPLHLEPEIIQNLFREYVEETNKSKNHHEPYGLIFNNCTSALWSIARRQLPISRRHIGLVFNKFLPKYLHKLGIVKLKERVMMGKKSKIR